MAQTSEDPRLVEVWVAMADHFLDTETRHDIPLTAWCCLQAGLSRTEARDVWCYEVSPAVAFNVWSVAGEWGAWDREWLLQRIRSVRRSWYSRPGTLRRLRYRIRVHLLHHVWVTIDRCMEALLAVPTPAGREQLTGDLCFLARHYFDFCPEDLAARDAPDRERIRSLYPEPCQRLLAPALVSGEASAADRRVRAALERPV